MNHYAKLATLAFRVVSIVLFLYAVVGLLVLARFVSGAAPGIASSVVLFPALAGLVIALLLYFTAPLLGRLAANGLRQPERTA